MIEAIAALTPGAVASGASQTTGASRALFDEALRNLDSAVNRAETQSLRLALEETDDLHGVMMDITRAQVSMQLAVEVRNRALDAYQELMRMPL